MLSQKHILILIQNLPVPFDRRVWQEAVSLRKAGFAVTVICPKKKIYTKSYESLEEVEIYRYSLLHDADTAVIGFFVEFLYCWLATLWLAARIYLRQPFHAIHACNPPDTFFALAYLFRPLGVKFVFDHHDLCPEMYVAKGYKKSGILYRALLLLEHLTFRSASAIIAVNQSHFEIALKRGGVEPERVTIVRSGPCRAWSEINTKDEELKGGRKYLVVFVGEMGSQDGVDHLLNAIRNYADNYEKDTLFALVGGGPEQLRMREMAERMALQEWVTFTGRITDDRLLWRYLSTADLCIAPDPSSEYGEMCTANKVIEYLAFGKAVVAFDLKEHRRTAHNAAEYVEPNSGCKLSLATHQLLLNEEQRREMGRLGQERFRKELAWEKSEEALVAMYSRLLTIR